MGSFFSKPAPPRANVYADHPFQLIDTPASKLPEGTKVNMFQECASIMALVHNIFIRYINSIYLQAPHVAPTDAYAFSNYMYQWCRAVHVHHSGEETHSFPLIEELSGEKGIMGVNVEQHRAFGEGFDNFEKYTLECIKDPKKFNGAEVVRLIDTFGEALMQHLVEEIGTLVGLERFGEDKMRPFEAAFHAEGKENMQSLGLIQGLPAAAMSHDVNFEGGRWNGVFPPGPGKLILAVSRNVTYYVHPDWWKFGPCDQSGRMQRLYAVPLEGAAEVTEAAA